MWMLPQSSPAAPPIAAPVPVAETVISPPVMLTEASPPMPAAPPFPVAEMRPPVMLTLPTPPIPAVEMDSAPF